MNNNDIEEMNKIIKRMDRPYYIHITRKVIFGIKEKIINIGNITFNLMLVAYFLIMSTLYSLVGKEYGK